MIGIVLFAMAWMMVYSELACVSYVPILTAGVMLCIVGDVQKFSVPFAKLDHGLCVVCRHTYGWCHVVYCGGCGPISNISVLSEFNRRKLLVIQSFIFLTHSVSLAE